MLLFGPENSRARDGTVEGDESPATFYRKGKQVNVGYLLRTVNAPVIDDSLVENAQVVDPVSKTGEFTGFSERQ